MPVAVSASGGGGNTIADGVSAISDKDLVTTYSINTLMLRYY